jgi:hypothetical protein
MERRKFIKADYENQKLSNRKINNISDFNNNNNNSHSHSSNNTKNLDMELQIPEIDPFIEQQIKDNENNYDCQSMCTDYDYNTNSRNLENNINISYKNNNDNINNIENEKDLISNYQPNNYFNCNSANLKEIINNQRQTILNLATKYKKIEYVLFTFKNEKENILNKNKELEEKILIYEKKIIDLNKDYEDYKIKSFEDFSYKEKKLLDLINKINDLEDENYRIIHCNKDIDKKKYLLMEKKTKELTMDFQKVNYYNINIIIYIIQ